MQPDKPALKTRFILMWSSTIVVQAWDHRSSALSCERKDKILQQRHLHRCTAADSFITCTDII